MKNIIHWILPDHIFRTYVTESYRNSNIKTLREWADEGDSDVRFTKEDVDALKQFIKKIEKMDNEEFLQSLCNTGLNLSQDGNTVQQLKLMVINRQLGLVEEEDRELYNTLSELIKDQVDKGKASMKDITKWFYDGKVFDNLSKFSLFYQGLYKKNPEEAILGVINRQIQIETLDPCTKTHDKNVKSKDPISKATSSLTLLQHLKNQHYSEMINEKL